MAAPADNNQSESMFKSGHWSLMPEPYRISVSLKNLSYNDSCSRADRSGCIIIVKKLR
jgi:hypothetical protein